MKKIYFTFCVALVFMAGNSVAQTIVTNQNQSTPAIINAESDNKVVTNNRSVLSVNPDQASTIEVKNAGQTTPSAIGPNETLVVTPVVKTTVTKAQFEVQSERGRTYILAHPELFTIEE